MSTTMDPAAQSTGTEIIDINPAAVEVNRRGRVRQKLEGIAELASQIRETGAVLQPIGITPDFRLLWGERRLQACRLLRWKSIPARIVNVSDEPGAELMLEIRENRDRMDFSLEDQVCAANKLRPLVEELIQAGRRSRPESGRELPHGIEIQEGDRTRDVLAREVGTGRDRLERAMKIANSVAETPALLPVMETMYATGNVNAAWDEFLSITSPTVDPCASDDALACEQHEPGSLHSRTVSKALADSDGMSDSTKAKQKTAPEAPRPEPAPEKDWSADDFAAELVAAIDAVIMRQPKDMRGEAKAAIPQAIAARWGALPGIMPETSAPTMPATADDLVSLLDDALHDLVPVEQATAIETIGRAYGPLTSHVDPDDLATLVANSLAEMAKKVRPVAAKQLANVLAAQCPKPEHHLPSLASKHADACDQLGKIVAAYGREIRGFEEWDQNGRPAAARALVKALQKRAVEIKNHCGLESLDEKQGSLVDSTWPEHLDKPEVHEAWALWLKSRRSRKLSVDTMILQKQINAMEILDPDQAREIILAAVEGGWQGIKREWVNRQQWCGRPPGHKPAEESLQSIDDEPENRWKEFVAALKKSKDEIIAAVADCPTDDEAAETMLAQYAEWARRLNATSNDEQTLRSYLAEAGRTYWKRSRKS